MSERQDCPSRDELRALSEGALAELDRRRITLHLESCQRCRTLLTNLALSGELTFVDFALPGLIAWSGNTGEPDLTETQRNDADDEAIEKSSLPPEIDMNTCRLGKYEILGVIGHGGMGIVLRGFDTSLHRPVAIKVLNRHLASSATARRRFQREARAAAAVSHPHVVTIHAVEEQNGLPYLIMEFIDGGSLEQRIRTQKSFPVKEILRLGSQIASGLAAAHAQGVIHRDIKPSNIMWEDGIGRVKITDFGLARVTMDNSELTSGGRAIGTPSYMSPEQVRGQPVDARADLFSLGCLLYAMVTGRSPFRASHSFEAARKVIDHQPLPLAEVDPRIPRFLSDIVAKLLEKDPAARYQTAAEIADIFTRHLATANQAQSDQLDTTLASFATVPPRPRRHLRWIAPLAVAVLLIATIVPVMIAMSSRSDSPVVLARLAALPKRPAPRTHLVRQTAGNGFTTIGAALAAAASGDTIRVLDSAAYSESLSIGPNLRGLRLEAPQRAVLRPANAQHAAIDIFDTADIIVSGLQIEAPRESHAIFIHGACSGIVVDNVACRHDADAGAAATVQIFVTADSASQPPIAIRNSQVASLGRGQCIWVSGSAAPAAVVELSGNRFECPGSHVVFHNAARKVLVRGNTFLGGTNGVNLDLREPQSDENLQIVNNTFFGTRYWLGLLSAQTDKPLATICNNLIVGSQRVQGAVSDWQQAAEYWNIHHNVWETDSAEMGEYQAIAEKLAQLIAAVDLQSREVGAAGFLRPADGSPLLTSGAGADYPAYVGAWGPLPPAAAGK